MRRKSERNKSKNSPEKKTEKATRKSTRKRGKRASSSPEREDIEDKVADTPVKDDSTKESTAQPATRQKVKELKPIAEETVQVTATEISSAEPETEAKPQEEGDGGSVWKVARADASPGEIQKLKLCRQRNTSEASDSSSSRKRSNKWHESGEGDAEEVDSADEPLRSSKRPLSGKQLDDPSSSHPGQDSNEEVSDSKEILPKTTPANLSDDKPNIDQLGDGNEASHSNQNDHIEKSPKSSCMNAEPSSNGDDVKEAIPKEVEPTGDDEKETANVQVKADGEPKDSNSDGEKGKTKHSDSSSVVGDEPNIKASRSGLRTSSRASRRKHRNKYHDSSDSDTPDSEDEPSTDKNIIKKDQQELAGSQKEKIRSQSPDSRVNSSPHNAEIETVQSEEGTQRSSSRSDDKIEKVLPAGTQSSGHKPAKVNLKRSFCARITETLETKIEDPDGHADSESSQQSKKNDAVNEEIETKAVPRKRRWGTALSTDAAPAFSVSTDSLKALVPGAKPLSITEVRLSKDDDEEKERRKEREKRYSISDSVGEHKGRDDGASHKNDASKKGDTKNDNHIGAKRKISILRQAPHIKSPTPPSSKPTNILLIKNLVRPFTLNQIRELLSRTGTIVENGFWMDGIKSKCFVEYANEDQAFETRQALHGISWPLSNPKRLIVEYATKEDMEVVRELSKDQNTGRKTEPLLASDAWQQDWARDEKATVTVKTATVREWDLGKEDGQHIKDKERERNDLDKKRRQRSRSPPLEAHLPPPARKFKKKEDEPPPAKLLDDLFRKTKGIPCIYWLPLTNEQIVVKEEMRRQHMAEHARRLEEMRRAERNRDGRRRRSPRK